jgi:hypothetical protein
VQQFTGTMWSLNVVLEKSSFEYKPNITGVGMFIYIVALMGRTLQYMKNNIDILQDSVKLYHITHIQ